MPCIYPSVTILHLLRPNLSCHLSWRSVVSVGGNLRLIVLPTAKRHSAKHCRLPFCHRLNLSENVLRGRSSTRLLRCSINDNTHRGPTDRQTIIIPMSDKDG